MLKRFYCDNCAATIYVGTAKEISRLWRNLYEKGPGWLWFPWVDPPKFNAERMYAIEILDCDSVGGSVTAECRVLKAEDLFRYDYCLRKF